MMSKPPICSLVSPERAIGYQHFAAADADGGGIAAWPEPRRGTGRHGRASKPASPRRSLARALLAGHRQRGWLFQIRVRVAGYRRREKISVAADQEVSIGKVSARREGDTAQNGR